MQAEYKFHVFGQATLLNCWNIKYRANINKLYYIHSGTAYYVFNGRRYNMLPGYVYLFPSSCDVRFYLEKDTAFDHTFFDFFSNPVIRLNDIVCIKAEEYPVLESTFSAACDILKKSRVGEVRNNYYCFYDTEENSEMISIMYHYFCVLMLLINSITPVYTAVDSRIFDALGYINTHYNEQITVKELAGLVFLEKNYFIKMFKKYVGKSPHQYIKDYRIDMALAMLERGKSVNETAFDCGYLSASSFSLAIKNKFGVSPTELIQS